MMAKAVGISASSVQRIWRTHGLQPHRVPQFKLSNDPKFIDKLRDVVGLYVDPPAHAIVLPVDEKSQIQALDRTQPGLPMKKGRAGTMTHDYKRHGTTTCPAMVSSIARAGLGSKSRSANALGRWTAINSREHTATQEWHATSCHRDFCRKHLALIREANLWPYRLAGRRKSSMSVPTWSITPGSAIFPAPDGEESLRLAPERQAIV